MPEDQNHIPEIDRKLAKKVGIALEENRSALSTDDTLIDQIGVFKNGIAEAYYPEVNESRNLSWEKIQTEIQRPSDNITYLKPNQQRKSQHQTYSTSAIWKVAAVFVLAVLLSIAYLQFDFNQSSILAESTTESVTYTMDDGTSVQLRPHSTLSLLDRSDQQERYELEGEGFFNVTTNDSREFIVEAGHGIIEVVGTSFNVREWGEETVVYLQEGSLLFSASNGSNKVELEPGEAATAYNNFSVSEPEQTDGDSYLSWQQNEIVFQNRTAGSIMRELEHHYSIKINAPERLKNEVLGGTLSLESQSASLENLGIVLGGNFSSIGDNTYQFVE